MTKAVFTTKIESGYDDVVELRYHFPETYLRVVEATVGDQIIYYEPRRGGGDMAYFGCAQVTGVRVDPKTSSHYYADLTGYLDFDRKVPFIEGGFSSISCRRQTAQPARVHLVALSDHWLKTSMPQSSPQGSWQIHPGRNPSQLTNTR